MSRPDQTRRQPGHDTPSASHHGAGEDRAQARPAAAGRQGVAPDASQSPAEVGDWDDWERELAARAGGPAENHDTTDDEDAYDAPAPDESHLTRVRIDKWLWAARFYRTRSLAKEAIEGGKVHCEGQRVKVSKDIRVGMTLDVRQGFDEKTVVVKALSEVRGGASVAQTLYEETAASVAAREQLQANRRAQNLAHPDHRPNKKDRRQIHRFKDSWND